MPTTKTLRPVTDTLLNASARPPTVSYRPAFVTNRSCAPTNHERHAAHRRTFVSNPFAGPQTLTASRTLPYPARVLYDVISDVSSYSHYVPFCRQSLVTKSSGPASDGKRYPEEVKLVVGFHDNVSEEFWSRVYCVPGSVVEAIAGRTSTTLSPGEVKHHSVRPAESEDPTRDESVLSHLLARWTLRPYRPQTARARLPDAEKQSHEKTDESMGQEKTEVNLEIEFQFANPLYAALSQAAAPRVADKMIEAFVKRVENVTQGRSHL